MSTSRSTSRRTPEQFNTRPFIELLQLVGASPIYQQQASALDANSTLADPTQKGSAGCDQEQAARDRLKSRAAATTTADSADVAEAAKIAELSARARTSRSDGVCQDARQPNLRPRNPHRHRGSGVGSRCRDPRPSRDGGRQLRLLAVAGHAGVFRDRPPVLIGRGNISWTFKHLSFLSEVARRAALWTPLKRHFDDRASSGRSTGSRNRRFLPSDAGGKGEKRQALERQLADLKAASQPPVYGWGTRPWSDHLRQ